MELFSVYFTQKRIVTKYDSAGNKTGEYTDDIAQTHHALPFSTAMQYKDCDNFRYERYYLTPSERVSGETNYRARHNSQQSRGTGRNGKGMRKGELHVHASGKSGKSAIQNAAMTGDFAASINAGE